jgi:hypothetical protein
LEWTNQEWYFGSSQRGTSFTAWTKDTGLCQPLRGNQGPLTLPGLGGPKVQQRRDTPRPAELPKGLGQEEAERRMRGVPLQNFGGAYEAILISSHPRAWPPRTWLVSLAVANRLLVTKIAGYQSRSTKLMTYSGRSRPDRARTWRPTN